MKAIYLKVQNQDNKPKSGIICSQPDNFTFADLLAWVYRNCGGYETIKIEPEKHIYLYYNDVLDNYRQEYWSLGQI